MSRALLRSVCCCEAAACCAPLAIVSCLADSFLFCVGLLVIMCLFRVGLLVIEYAGSSLVSVVSLFRLLVGLWLV